MSHSGSLGLFLVLWSPKQSTGDLVECMLSAPPQTHPVEPSICQHQPESWRITVSRGIKPAGPLQERVCGQRWLYALPRGVFHTRTLPLCLNVLDTLGACLTALVERGSHALLCLASSLAWERAPTASRCSVCASDQSPVKRAIWPVLRACRPVLAPSNSIQLAPPASLAGG